ncbi:MAG: FAD:protein FMN transferase [Devosia sp.]|nr:FAD:protein FMN transferase [Devosia sp.]
MAQPLNRRRVIGITAAAAGLSLLPFGRESTGEALAVTWRGQALGAQATLLIHHDDRALALSLVEGVTAEVRRLERIFSLYRDDSDLVSLNRRHAIAAPPIELVELLQKCRSLWELTGGAFDPTVQPLWTIYQRHFSDPDADPAGPSPRLLRDTLDRVGFDGVLSSRDRVEFLRPGMALTLNGIAQGYITDRIVELLRAGGIDRCLVDMGETRAVGSRPDGREWRVAIADPNEPGRDLAVLDVVDRAVATSTPYGFRFDRKGRFNHLVDPRSGQTSHRYESVTVVASDAADADALATAFSLMDTGAIAKIVAMLGKMEVYLAPYSGEHLVLRS